MRVNLYRILHLLAAGALQGVHVDEAGNLRGILPLGQTFSLALSETGHPSSLKISPGEETEQHINYSAWKKSGLVSFATEAHRAGDPPSKQAYAGPSLLKMTYAGTPFLRTTHADVKQFAMIRGGLYLEGFNVRHLSK